MSEDRPDEGPELPPELAELLRQLGGPGILEQFRAVMASPEGPVNWEIARRLALQLAADGDRAPTDEERSQAEQAQGIAEHWLDEGSLPAPPSAGRLAVVGRQSWVNAALDGLRPLVEPVAAASVRALGDLLAGELEGMEGLEDLPELEGFEGLEDLGGLDLGALGSVGDLLAPMGALLAGLQAGQVVGQLAHQMLGQFDLGIPTADRDTAYRLPVNVDGAFAGYGLDPTEVAVVLALQEGAHRRQYHAVPWLAGHVQGLVASFAAGMRIDRDRLEEVARDVMADVDPEDPESLRSAMDRAAAFRVEPTPEQRRILERLQGVVSLLGAWARHEVATAASDRLPNLPRIEEVLRRRRAEQGPGEEKLATLLGLDLQPDDETMGARFVAAVHAARGLAGLRRALAHPENLPDAEEVAEPARWLGRMAAGEDIPDDASSLFGPGEAPTEPPGDERGEDS
ncbi:MAG: zinc-dependent metalloprotease [Nitriliruptorales bacterium]